MKKFLIAAVIIICATGLAQATIIIDDFTKNGTPNNDLTIGPGTNPTGACGRCNFQTGKPLV
jgi:hypothetical protein